MKFFFLLLQTICLAQTNSSFTNNNNFFIEVIITAKATKTPIKNAEVAVNGKNFYYSEINGFYKVNASINDELIVSHPDFETVFYTIKSNEEIRIEVENFPEKNAAKSQNLPQTDVYLQHLDSAKFYKTKNIEKSLAFVEKAIQTDKTKKRNATSYKTLADIYLFWKQYDLAVYNYKLSNQIAANTATEILIAKAQFLLKDYANSKVSYLAVLAKKLTQINKVIVLEGLGDIGFKTKNYNYAKANYNKAFSLAKKHKITPKITDISSKLATVFSAEGNIDLAKNQFNNTLNFAAKESKNRVLQEEEKVADFLNTNKEYDKEIALRKQSLLKTNKKKVSEAAINLEDSITTQKINYKIGNAYLLKEQYKEAIPYFEKSISAAEKSKDIVIEKDATKKISEVFENLGAYDKALENYQKYVTLVDSLYIRKEQEIHQVKRFSKKIADNQNRIASLEKDRAILETNQKLSEANKLNQKKIIGALITVVSLLILFSWFMYRNNKKQKLTNNLLALKSMRSQMNPHFIFNALNSVNSFIATNDERNANRYLSEFSVLMRAVLENSDEDFIPLTKEIELLELYVKLEHNRFKNKFNYTINVEETIALEKFEIPPMLLQPYIENAIWHGLRYRKEIGNLEISIQQKDTETLLISITDDGIGRAKSLALKTNNQLKQKSKGMSTIKKRIAILNDMYKDRIKVNVTNLLDNGEGTKITLLLKSK